MDRAKALVASPGVDAIVIDTAHGHFKRCLVENLSKLSRIP